MMITVVLLLLSATPTEDAAARAEADAFAAVDGQRWCDAVHLFEQAHALAPAPALLDNAAQAAELADDRAAARRLLTAAIDAVPAAARKPLKARLAVVDKQLKNGPGTPCPPVVAAPAPVEVAPVAPLAPVPVVVEAPIAVEPEVVDVVTGPPLAPIATTALGAALVIGGGITAAVGLQPWFAHADAVKRLQSAEGSKTVDDTALSDQRAARTAWEGSGQLLTAVGAVAVGAGVVAVAVGIVLFAAAE